MNNVWFFRVISELYIYRRDVFAQQEAFETKPLKNANVFKGLDELSIQIHTS